MRSRATLHTRPRCDRLADRTRSGSLPSLLLVGALLVLVHPALPATGLLALLGWRLRGTPPWRWYRRPGAAVPPGPTPAGS
jgi:hypothetical protein